MVCFEDQRHSPRMVAGITGWEGLFVLLFLFISDRGEEGSSRTPVYTGERPMAPL